MEGIALEVERRRLRGQVLTVPNVITAIRLALGLFAIHRMSDDTADAFWTALLFGVAGGGDALDGYLARVLNQATVIGRIFDENSDKVLVVAVHYMLVSQHHLPEWVGIATASREIIVSGLRAAAPITIPSSFIGKSKTQLQMWGASFLIAHYRLPFNAIVVDSYHQIGLFLTYLSLVASFWSAWQYLRAFAETLVEE